MAKNDHVNNDILKYGIFFSFIIVIRKLTPVSVDEIPDNIRAISTNVTPNP
ncbi:hypothetical protein LD85_2685 [Saccharolobus islandicus L.D.8.5]|uniref:Uncharacterized protein n=1 Tax=Saccharolobus islandicus (strain L.D.8.5 / Lassen \|nr:hypothetical protein LD85_2685 [Sulfolobus islandicus L.D.8.5]